MSEEEKLKEIGNAIMFGIDPLEAIVINKANLLHIAETGKLNGSLLNDLKSIINLKDSRIRELETDLQTLREENEKLSKFDER